MPVQWKEILNFDSKVKAEKRLLIEDVEACDVLLMRQRINVIKNVRKVSKRDILQ